MKSLPAMSPLHIILLVPFQWCCWSSWKKCQKRENGWQFLVSTLLLVILGANESFVLPTIETSTCLIHNCHDRCRRGNFDGMMMKTKITMMIRPSPSLCCLPAVSSSCGNANDHHNATVDESSSFSRSPLLSPLLRPPMDTQVNRMSTTDLAYIGDVVYELFIRSYMIWPLKRTSVLQEKVVALVRAEYQAQILQYILLLNDNSDNNNNSTETDSSHNHDSKFVLTAEERLVVSRGRNAVSGGSKRRSRNSDNKSAAKAYQDATALEALIGHLYISNPGRCAQLLSFIQQEFLVSSSSLPSSSSSAE